LTSFPPRLHPGPQKPPHKPLFHNPHLSQRATLPRFPCVNLNPRFHGHIAPGSAAVHPLEILHEFERRVALYVIRAGCGVFELPQPKADVDGGEVEACGAEGGEEGGCPGEGVGVCEVVELWGAGRDGEGKGEDGCGEVVDREPGAGLLGGLV